MPSEIQKPRSVNKRPLWKMRFTDNKTEIRLESPIFNSQSLLWLFVVLIGVFTIHMMTRVTPEFWALPLLALLPLGLFQVLGRHYKIVAIALSTEGYRLENKSLFKQKVLRAGPLSELKFLEPLHIQKGKQIIFVLPIQTGQAVYHFGEGHSENELRSLSHKLQQTLQDLRSG